MNNPDASVKIKAPKHIGLILDGNRRWAKERGLDTLEGHRAGYENLKSIANLAWDKGVEYLSAYVFSTENWNRSKREVNYLMGLVTWAVEKDLKELEEKGVKIIILGSKEKLSPKILKAINDAEARTQNNTKGTLALCFNYGGQQEICDAFNQLKDKFATKNISTSDIRANLYHPELPDLDLVIRTSGEKRLSNFMLWRAAYAELFFVDKYWPDFDEADLDQAIEQFNNTERRFGGD